MQKLISIGLLLITTTLLRAEDVDLSARHMLVMSADTQHIWGTYYFAVINNSKEAKLFRTKVMLPLEMIDFKAQEGLSPTDLQLSGTDIFVVKNFPPGMNLVGVGFKAQVTSFGRDTLTFVPPTDIDELDVTAAQNSGLKFQSPNFDSSVPSMLAASGHYIGIQSRESLKAGVPIKIEVLGIPKERLYLQIIGAIMGAILLLMSAGLVVRTRGTAAQSSRLVEGA